VDLGTVDLLARLAVAAVLGAAVGAERESAARGAGARTHALVALGAALFTLAGAYGFGDIAQTANVDPARIAAQVAAGVGFIGAGAIIRNGPSVHGVTTAATVWLAASVGVVAAAGGYVAALATTALALLVLVVLRAARPLLRRLGRSTMTVEVEYVRGHGTLGPLLRGLEANDARLDHLAVADDGGDGESGLRQVTLHVTVPHLGALDRVLDDVGSRPETRAVRVGNGESG
jgi:putative Mg2+ transporter-C (MgtC) family protein